MKHIPNICRLDNDQNRTHAWLVRVQRKNNVTIKMFSDGQCGGKQKAKSAALAFRNSLVLGTSPAERNLWHRTIVRRNNTSGIPGVGLYARESGKERWIAYWIDENGVRKSRSFSVDVYGKRKAKQLAVNERMRQLERLLELQNLQQA